MEGYTTETEQLQALKKWWDDNAKWIVTGLAIAAIVVGGWKFWGYWEAKRADQAAGLYGAVIQAENKNDTAGVDKAARKVLHAFPKSAYGALAGLALAKSQVSQGHLSDAVGTLRNVANDSPDAGLAAIARIRLARVQLQRGNAKEALDALKHPGSKAFDAMVESLRGDALMQMGQTQAARAAYEKGMKATDSSSPLHHLLAMRLSSLPAASTAAAAAPAAQTAASPKGGRS